MTSQEYKEIRQGQTRINHQGLKMTVVDYVDSHHVYVGFEDKTIVKAEWREFNRGSTINPNYKNNSIEYTRHNRLGEEKINNQGCVMKIVEYNNANDITIQFDNNPEHTIKSYYLHFKNGIAHNPFHPSVYGIGITGTECPCMDGNVKLKEYRAWVDMLKRCTKGFYRNKNMAYEDCEVGEEFLYYPNYYKWITSQENYEVWKNTPNFAVDKDIIVKGNKIYAPDKCCLVPNRINNLIKPNKKRRGECVIGVFKKPNGKFVAQCWDGLLQKNIFLGNYENEMDGFIAYKKYKEQLIKETAEIEYKNGVITQACRDALFNYEVEITD